MVPKSRTKNVSSKKRSLLVGPSDRIATNYTPSAKHLVLKNLRKRRKRFYIFTPLYGTEL